MSWTDFKSICNSKSLLMQIEAETGAYYLAAYDGPQKYATSIMKEDPANADQTDFETNYKSNTNKKLEPIDEDSATIVRPKAAKAGWKAQFHSLRISTATTSGIVSKKRDGSNTGFTTYVMKDVNGATTAVEAGCVETVITWEPDHDMELVGGQLLQSGPPSTSIMLWVTAAAHIPAAYGGSVAFSQGGLELMDVGSGGTIDLDGRVSKFIAYDSVNHSGRFEVALKHAAGTQHSFTIIFELFKP